MARLIVRALTSLGHEVSIASEMRSFMRSADMRDALKANMANAADEIERIASEYSGSSVPDLWFTYHPYYKAPDLLGPALSQHFGIPLVNAEASYSSRRNIGAWETSQELLIGSLRNAAVNLCFTRRDRDGLQAAVPEARLELITPFIDSEPYLQCEPAPEPGRLITVAMMRPATSFPAIWHWLKA